MKNNLIMSALIVGFVMFAGCVQQSTTPTANFSSLIISKVYENGFCSPCATNLTILSNGSVTYYEKNPNRAARTNADNQYTYFWTGGNISRQQFSQLVSLFNDNDIFSSNNAYHCKKKGPAGTEQTEVGYTIFSITDETGERSVSIGDDCEFPFQLNAIAEKLEKIKETLK